MGMGHSAWRVLTDVDCIAAKLAFNARCDELLYRLARQPGARVAPHAGRGSKRQGLRVSSLGGASPLTQGRGGANNWLKSLKALFRWAVEADLLSTNPAKDIPRIKTSSQDFHT